MTPETLLKWDLTPHPEDVWGVTLWPCDIVFCRSRGFISRAIRGVTQTRDEGPTVAAHVDCVVVPGTLKSAIVIGALRTRSGVSQRTFFEYSPGTGIAIARPIDLSRLEQDWIVSYLRRNLGKTYGYTKLFFQLLDHSLLGGRVFFRRMGVKSLPICSTLVAQAYASAGLDFGIKAKAASPDDLWDFATNEPEKYKWPIPECRPLLPYIDVLKR